MFESENKLRHLPFFEEIATLEEGDPEWRAATAGLVVLRLVDVWLEEGPALTSDDAWTIRSVRNAIEEVEATTPIRSLLGRVLDALQTRKPDIHVVVTPLMAYAQALEYDAKWLLAADVYHTVLAHLHPVEDSDASIAAHLRLGSCYRNLQLIGEASLAFASASEIATAVGDMVGMLRSRIGDGSLAILSGNLPRAEAILDETIDRAVGSNLRDVRARALHSRSNVANLRKQYELAIRFAYDALCHSETPSERDRILHDLAGSFLDLGVYSAARDGYLILSATAQEQYTRWAATLNLMEIAALTGAELQFEHYKRDLNGKRLPPFLATRLEFHLGTGYQRFGDIESARRHLERAVFLAAEHSLSQTLFDAEEALYSLETPTASPKSPGALSLDVEEVANAIREMKELAGVT